MGNGQRRSPDHQLIERLLQGPFRRVVQSARRLVEDQHLRIAQDGSRDGQPLLLAAGEAMPARSHDRVQPVGQGRHQVGDLSGGQGLPQFGLSRGFLGQQQVVADRGMHQIGLLRDHPDDGGQGLGRQVPQVDTVDRDPSDRRIVQPREQTGDARLARSCRTHQRQGRSGRDGQRESADSGSQAPGIRHGDVLEPDVPTDPSRIDPSRTQRSGHVGHQVEVFEDAREERHRGDPLCADVEQAHERSEDARLQGREGDEGADRHAARGGG